MNIFDLIIFVVNFPSIFFYSKVYFIFILLCQCTIIFDAFQVFDKTVINDIRVSIFGNRLFCLFLEPFNFLESSRCNSLAINPSLNRLNLKIKSQLDILPVRLCFKSRIKILVINLVVSKKLLDIGRVSLPLL